MTSRLVLREADLESLRRATGGSCLIGFGSYFRASSNPKDIDIGVVCHSDADHMVKRLRASVRHAQVDQAATYSPAVPGGVHVTVVPAVPSSLQEAAFLHALRSGVQL